MKKTKVIIQGFGVVGASTAINIVSSNNFNNIFKVHCIEKANQTGITKINAAKKGIFPISTSDKLLDIYLKKALQKNKISFGFDQKEYKNADIIIISINCDLNNKNTIKIMVTCGRGTYIRSLARDIAKQLDTIGHLVSLKRTRIGEYEEKNCIEINDFPEWISAQT